MVDVDGLIRWVLSVHQDLRGGLVDVDVGKDVVMMSAFSLRIFERYGRRYTSRSTEKRLTSSGTEKCLAARYPRESLVTLARFVEIQ